MPGSTTTRSSRNCYLSLVPMSVRQQLKLVRQLETSDENGGNPSIKDTVLQRPRSRSCNGRGETPLHKAAIKGDEELVVKLLEEGADPNVSDFAGWTPLHEACNHGWYGVALALIKAGASVNATGFDNDTPLHDAAINGHSKLVRLLVEQGADVHFRNKGGKTPCDVAAPGLMPHLLPCSSVVGKGSKLTLGLSQTKKKEDKVKTESKDYNLISRIQNLNNMEEKNSKEDVYEFKSSKEATPVRGNSISPDVDKNNSEIKSEKVEAYSGAETESVAAKRTISEVGDNDEVEDDGKKRKRKEKEGGDGKDMLSSSKSPATINRTPTNRNSNANNEKGGKVLLNKNSGQNSVKTGSNNLGPDGNSDRKSPSSPKAFMTGPNTNNSSSSNNKTETEQDDGKANSDGEKMDQGPKVPPLKIVIPPQTAGEAEQGNRNGKNSASRHHHHHHHQALPYVVTSNNEGEKEGLRSGSASPTDSFKSDEKKDPAIGMLSAEDQKNSLHHQRVLRSSHRSGPGGANENRTQETSTSNATNNGSSNASAPSTDNLSPQAQNRTSPLPQNESSTVAPGVSAASDNSSSSSNSSNTRANVAPPSKNNQGSSNPTPTVISEDKAPDNNTESSQVPSQSAASATVPVELHPRKRKLKHNKEIKESPPPQVTSERCESATASTDVHPHEQPVKNCYQLFLDIRKQIERRRKGLFPVQPKPPQGFKDYLMNRCTYILAGNASARQIPSSPLPQNISKPMKDLFAEQEKERHRLRLQHVIEKEKLVLSVEQEILRVHGRAARALANQSLPFSACTILKDEEVYNLITPEQEEKDRNARSRYNGRLFLSWLQDVDDKWEKIKEAMLLRHHNEAESLHAVQKMDWEWKMKELGFCEYKSKPVILDNHVPMVHVSDDFDLLPA